jgi:uncharacterized protein YcnI
VEIRMKIRLVTLVALVLGTVALVAVPASAHVTITPSSAPKGGGDQLLSFNVPNEEDNANTVKLEVILPTKYPIASVTTKSMYGWTTSVETKKLTKPITTDDGQITEAVSSITWTATDGGLNPGEFDLFTISAGQLPTKPNTLTFKAIQTYSNGDTVSWIQRTVKGAPEPDHPAPTLKLTKASSISH